MSQAVSGICFVQDYVEIHFDGPRLRCIAPPTIKAAGRGLVFPSPGSRDVLCELIGQNLVELKIDEEKAMTLRFERGVTVFIPLSDPKSITGEFVHFVSGDVMDVW